MAKFLRISENNWVNVDHITRVSPSSSGDKYYALRINERKNDALPLEVNVEKSVWQKYVESLDAE